MRLVKVRCAFCKKEYFRQKGRVNEAKRFGWNQYCSKKCQNNAAITRVEKTCGNLACNKSILRLLSQFKKSKSGLVFCSQSCSAIINNKIYPKKSSQPKFKICQKCGQNYKKITGNKKYCSVRCALESRQWKKQDIIKIIKAAAQKLGRTPAKRELNSIQRTCTKLFGSWNNAVLASSLIPNRSHDKRMYKRSSAKAIDGHLCDSISELLIDNWLYKNNVQHRKNTRYPETNHEADWEIMFKNQKIFIEYFGLANDSPRYDRAIKEKKRLCLKYKIKLIEIYHWDLYPQKKFEEKIKIKLKKLKSS